MLEERLKALRKDKKMTQIETANAILVPVTTYRRYENEESETPSNVLLNLSRLFGVSVDWLLGNSDVRNTNNAETPQNFGDMIDVLCRQLTRLEKESEVNPENLPRLTEAMCNIVGCLTTLRLSDITKKDLANKV